MNRKLIGPALGALLLMAAVPTAAWAHGHGRFSGDPSAVHSSVAASASTTSSPTSSTGPTTPGAGRGHAPNPKAQGHRHGPPANVAQLRTLRAKLLVARRQYVQAVQTYFKTFSQALAAGQVSQESTALMQLTSIQVTLAQAVKTEMAAQTAGNSHGGGLANVVVKFQAELTALENAATEVQTLTQQLSSGAGSSASPSSTSSSPTSSSSPSS